MEMNVEVPSYGYTTELLDLPNETLINIFEFLKFEEVAKYRIVCKRFDDICQKILNRGFQRAAHQHAATYKRIKSRLPRRESERRNHALARHADILTSIETRISMLSMTYTKYIDLNMCCFIPGRVLDEIFHILQLTMQSTIQLRPLEILQEFRDISSMAIEHFDEKIASEFKKIIERNSYMKAHGTVISGSNRCNHRSYISDSLTNISVAEPNDVLVVTRQLKKHSPNILSNQTGLAALSDIFQQPSETRKQNTSIQKLQWRMKALQKKSSQQKKNLNFFVRKVNSLTTQINCMKRRLDELDSKNQELIGTIRQYNTEESQAENANGNGNARPTCEANENIHETNASVPTSATDLEATSDKEEIQTTRAAKRPCDESCENMLVKKKQKN